MTLLKQFKKKREELANLITNFNILKADSKIQKAKYDSNEDMKEERIDIYEDFGFEKKKRQRRPAESIDRIFKCPYNPCTKSYG